MGRLRLFRTFFIMVALFIGALGVKYLYDKNKENVKKLLEIKESIKIHYHLGDSESNVSHDVTLPQYVDGVEIKWYSSNPNVLAIDDDQGIITTTETDKTVTLTATFQRYGKSELKSFNLIIKNERYLIQFEGFERFNSYVGQGGVVELPPEPEQDGYEFQYWSTSEDGEPYDFNGDNPGGVTLYPVFVANSNIEYKVEHYFENGNGTYSLSETVELTGKTDQLVVAELLQREGYEKCNTLNSKEEGKILADGSLVLKVYYCLVKYEVHFELGLGEGNFPKTFYKHGTVIPKPLTLPTATGRHFTHWSLEPNGTAFNFNQKLNRNVTLYAVYDKNLYDVKFYNGETLLVTQKVFYQDSASLPNIIPEKEGYDFIGWDHNLQNITGNVDIYAQFEIKVHIIYFYDNNNWPLSIVNAEHFSDVTPPAAPEVEGHDFIGWDHDLTSISSSMIVKPLYKKQTYEVNFYVDDHLVDTQEVRYNESATPPLASEFEHLITEKNNQPQFTYTFTGWNQSTQQIKGDTDVIAKFDVVTNKYQFKFFDEDGVTILKEGILEYGKLITPPAQNPQKMRDEQYTYTFEEYVGFEGNEKIVGDITFTAKYSKQLNVFVVNFYVDGTLKRSEEVRYGYDATPPVVEKPQTISQTFTFDGWDRDYTFVKTNLDVHAKFIVEPRKYTITFADDLGNAYDVKEWNYNQTPIYEGTPYKEGGPGYSYVFTGWTPQVSQVNADRTYHANFQKIIGTYKVEFYVGYDKVAETRVEYGNEAFYPYHINPRKNATDQYSYIFTGWDKPLTNITKDTKVVAEFDEIVNQYSYQIISNNQIIKYGRVDYGTAIPEVPNDPDNKFGYHFIEWRSDNQSFSFTTPIKKDTVIEAYFEINRYLIKFVNYDDQIIESISNIEHGIVPVFPGTTPTKPSDDVYNYHFSGWDSALFRLHLIRFIRLNFPKLIAFSQLNFTTMIIHC